MKLLIATKNPGKVREMRELLAPEAARGLEVLTLADFPPVPDPVEDAATFLENARIKALAYADALGVMCIADDSGISVEPLGGRPGVLSARYAGENATDEDNNALLLAELAPMPKPWPAAYFCVAVAAVPGRVIAEGHGTIRGEITTARAGSGGFGYDPYFVVEGGTRTMAELSPDEKNRISHRGHAMRELVGRLRDMGALA
jgi:XTP/dITP diphosphohydrolase